ncbi:MAG: FadR family transcriptional regulator [Firmicutes bacterium]|nr:FadR family transcriptional regulator [Bacillota bacterium]
MEVAFKPIKSIKVYRQVIEQIQEMIYTGHLKKGDRLPSERELRDQLNVSRASIREAFSVLEILGLIESRPGEGTFITSSRENKILEPLSMVLMLEDNLSEDLLEFRRVLEIDSARLAAERVTETELEEMKKYNDILANSLGHEEISVRADRMFHSVIAKSSKNKVLYDVMVAISDAMDYHIEYTRTKLVSETDTMNNFVQQHWRIYEAIKNGQGKEAMREMENHLDYVEKLVKKKIFD